MAERPKRHIFLYLNSKHGNQVKIIFLKYFIDLRGLQEKQRLIEESAAY